METELQDFLGATECKETGGIKTEVSGLDFEQVDTCDVQELMPTEGTTVLTEINPELSYQRVTKGELDSNYNFPRGSFRTTEGIMKSEHVDIDLMDDSLSEAADETGVIKLEPQESLQMVELHSVPEDRGLLKIEVDDPLHPDHGSGSLQGEGISQEPFPIYLSRVEQCGDEGPITDSEDTDSTDDDFLVDDKHRISETFQVENELTESDSDSSSTDQDTFHDISDVTTTSSQSGEEDSSERRQLNIQGHERNHSVNNVHVQKKPLECSFCHKTFSDKSNLARHSRIHTGDKLFRCAHCTKAFTSKSNLETHERIHTGDKPFKCHQCGEEFSRKDGLIRHEHNHTGDRPFKCSSCTKSFMTKFELKRHAYIHATNNKTNFKNISAEALFKCKFCEREFSEKGGLVEHECTQTGNKPFQCGQGDQALSAHLVVRIRTNEKSYKCKWCEKTFSLSCNRNRHERIHTGKKPFGCNFCGKAFSQRSQLVVHERIHTGDKPFKCGYCDKAFAQKGCLTTHERRTHTGDEPFICDNDDITFSHKAKGDHAAHERTNQRFSQKGDNAAHERTNQTFSLKDDHAVHEHPHTGVQPFKSEDCDKALLTKINLAAHKGIHTGDEPFKCTCRYCKKVFSCEKDLGQHKCIVEINLLSVTTVTKD